MANPALNRTCYGMTSSSCVVPHVSTLTHNRLLTSADCFLLPRRAFVEASPISEVEFEVLPMIDEKERDKRRAAYELAKENSRKRGVELTPETEKLMSQYFNGEIDDQAFFAEIWRLLGVSPRTH